MSAHAYTGIIPSNILCNIFFLLCFDPIQGRSLPLRASRSDTLDTPHSVGILWTSDRPDARYVPDSAQQSQQIDVHAPGGIRTRNPSKRAAADPRLRQCGHWDRPLQHYLELNLREFG